MQRARRTTCRDCGNPPPRGTRISKQGYCTSCGEARMVTAIEEMRARSGPHYERWRERLVEVDAPTLPKSLTG